MGIKFSNNASSTLATGITAVATSLTVDSGDGALFPAAGGSDWFYCTLIIAATNTREIVKVTSRTGDVFTITRAQEGTTATVFSAGDLVRLQLTAAALNEFVSAAANTTFSGDNTFSGANTFSGNNAFSGTNSFADVTTFNDRVDFEAGVDVASATTVDLTAATGNLVRITGTTATTGVTINNGQVVLCYPTGAWPLTYHATTMPIKGGMDYTCAAGDTVIFSKDGNGTLHVALASGSSLTIGAFTAWTSGAYKDITGLPAGAKRITISPKSLSTTGTSNLLIQIGDATGGLKTSGYESGCTNDSATRTTSTAGFIVSSVSNAPYIRSGTVVLTLVDSSNNAWAMSGQISETGSGLDANSGGQVTLSGPLDRFRFTTVGGTDTGDAGGFGYSVEA